MLLHLGSFLFLSDTIVPLFKCTIILYLYYTKSGVRAVVQGSSVGVPAVHLRKAQLGLASDHDDLGSLR